MPPTIDLTDEEYAAVTTAVRRSIVDDKFPLSPRLAPLKSALATRSRVGTETHRRAATATCGTYAQPGRPAGITFSFTGTP
jgi:hypothetical protein